MSDGIDHGRERSPFLRSSFLAAAGFVAMVVVFGVLVVLNRNSPAKPGHVAAPVPTPSAPAPAPSAAGCHLPAGDQRIPSAGPQATWTLFKGVAVPSSRTAGPAISDGDAVRCFAHTPTGALFAVQQIATRNILADDWRRVSDEDVMPGAGRDVWDHARAKADLSHVPATGYGQIAGFKFVTYTPATAVIEIASRFPDGTLQSAAATVMWFRGDWRLQLQPDGGEAPTAHQLPSLDGYIPWGGV